MRITLSHSQNRAEDIVIGAMQKKVLQTLTKLPKGTAPPEGLFNTRGAGVRKHTLTDMLLRGLVAAKPATKGAAMDFTITPLGAKVLKLSARGQNVAKLPASGYRKVLPQAGRARRVA